MKRYVVAWLVMLLAPSASAQAPSQVESVAGPFLEKRVSDELATEGVVLSRGNLELHIEQIGGKWLVSLVDLAAGRMAASATLDTLPADPDAAVAAMTRVVADLASHVAGRAEPAAHVDDRGPREAGEGAELTYKRQSIHLGSADERAGSSSHPTLRQNWTAYLGEVDQTLDPLAFYARIGRPDLADKYIDRRRLAIGGGIVSVAAAAVAVGLVLLDIKTAPSCPPASFQKCDEHAAQYSVPIYGAVGVSALGALLGIRYWRNPQPIEENEAKSLVDDYNGELRKRLGLPVVTRRPLLRELKVAPYVTAQQGGVALSARF
jgi:hypothetical protein